MLTTLLLVEEMRSCAVENTKRGVKQQFTNTVAWFVKTVISIKAVKQYYVCMLHFTIQWSEQSETPSLRCFLNELLTQTSSVKKHLRCSLGLIVHNICHHTGVNNLYIEGGYNPSF